MLNGKSILLFIISLFLCACGAQPTLAGNPVIGKTLFQQSSIGSAPGCSTCHSTQPEKVIVGPSLAGVAKRASQRMPGQTAGEYLQDCILTPNLYVVDGFTPGLMYQHYEDTLTDEQVRDLVAYLSTLE